MKTIDVTDKAIAFCAVKARTAAELTREDIQALTYWCDCQAEALWDGMTLQEILNVYRVSAEWMTWEDWSVEQPQAAVRGWNRAVGANNKIPADRAACRPKTPERSSACARRPRAPDIAETGRESEIPLGGLTVVK